MDRDDLIVRAFTLGLELHDAAPELGDRHFLIALEQAATRKDAVRVHRKQKSLEPADLVFLRLLHAHLVAGAVLERELHGPICAIQQDIAALRNVGDGILGIRRVGDEYIAPTCALGFAHIQDNVREIFEEHPRLDLGLGSRADNVEGDLPEGLIRRGHQHDHGVQRGGRRRHGEHPHRHQEATQADPAGLESDGFPVRRKPPQRNQQPHQKRHRNRDAERLWNQRQQHLADDSPGHPLRNQPFALGDDGGQLEDEREHE